MIGKFGRIAIAVAGLATAALPLAAEAQARPNWGGGRSWRSNRGIDGGDVLAGLLIIGGIAAIASAASNANNRRQPRDQDVREPEWRDQDWRDPNPQLRNGTDQREPYRDDNWGQGAGQRGPAQLATRNINDAVERCVDEASRTGDVEEVFDATRNGSGYRIAGTLRSGDAFSCEVSGQGGVLLDIRRGQR